jgi:transcriptional regulator with XRE-family HTH domain
MERRITGQFGKLIRRLRSAAGFSQEAFADRCGLHRTYIGTIERGEKSVTIETAAKLAAALGLTLSQLFHELGRDSNK